jgi:hypothetical protein
MIKIIQILVLLLFSNFRIPDLVTENWAIQPMIRKI